MPASSSPPELPSPPGLELAISPLAREHIDQVWALEQASFKNPWSRSLFLGELASPLARDRVVLLQPAGTVVAFICLWLVAGEAQVQNLAVHPAFRRRGIGRWLLLCSLAEARAAGARTVTLEVRSGNLAARRLYESLGFGQQGVRSGYYRDEGEDALLLGRPLAGLPSTDREKS